MVGNSEQTKSEETPMLRTLIYVGIGSRKTPDNVLQQMFEVAQQLAESGWLLRSGHADGADNAFEAGCLLANGPMEIYVPWFGFNDAPRDHPDYIRPKATQELADFSRRFHPAWDRCSDAAKLLHMRNACQVLGLEGNKPADLLICWTPKGNGLGGTGQAIRIAQEFNIPVFDLGIPGGFIAEELCKFVEICENNLRRAA